MKNNKHTVAFYQKQKDKLDNILIYYETIQKESKVQLESYIRTYYQNRNKLDALSKACYDLMKYATREITREAFLSKYSFINDDNYIYYTFIQYAHVYTMLEKKKKEYKVFIDNFKQAYPEEVLF